MELPFLTELNETRTAVGTFLGLNRNPGRAEGELADMENLSSDRFPLLSTRKRRGIHAAPGHCTGLIAKDTLCYTDGSCFVMDGYRVELGLSDAPKQLVSMGSHVIILPDKKYINTADLTDSGNLEAEFTGNITLTLCAGDGTGLSPDYSQPETPADPAEGALWLDTGAAPACLRRYAGSTGVWAEVPATFVRLSAPGLGAAFAAGDGVRITGLAGVAGLSVPEGYSVIACRGQDFLVVPGLICAPAEAENVTVERRMPELDFVIESENRLWGCRYGTAANGETVNEIYASKLGDFRNWNCFQGVSTDSYAVSLGTDGAFTGAVNHLGYPLFFKETCIHKVYGSYPAAYRLQTVACPGVQRGSEKSLGELGGVLYYKAPDGVYAFDGSLPRKVSGALGQTPFRNAAGGALGDKYYISMEDPAGDFHLLVLDTARGLWHREDGTRAEDFCPCRGELYFLDHTDGKIRTVLGSGTPEAEPVSFRAVTGELGLDSPDCKFVSRLNLRLELGAGAELRVFVNYDSGPDWERVCTLTGTGLGSISVPVKLRRCDHFRLRLEGTGDAAVYGIVKTVSPGSDARRRTGLHLG